MLRKAIVVFVVAALLLQTMLIAVAYAASQPNIEQHIFIHYAKENKGKPPAGNTGYYKLLGAKWKTLPVTLEVNPTNPNELPAKFVLDAIGMAAEEWDDGDYSGWTGVAVNLFNDAITTTDKEYDNLAWSSSKLDGANTIIFGNYPTSGVIAVTIIWSSRTTKAIVEFDMVLDTDFTWDDAATDSTAMDLQNIVTHELGHGVGLGDLYQTAAYRETMYGYATEGETIKRSLYIGDQTGIKKLYG